MDETFTVCQDGIEGVAIRDALHITLCEHKAFSNRHHFSHEYKRETCYMGKPPSGGLCVTYCFFVLKIAAPLWKSAAPYGIVICEILNEFAGRAFSNNITIPG